MTTNFATTEALTRPATIERAPVRPSRRRADPRTVVSQVLLTAVLLLFLMPFVWMIATALKPPAEVFGAGSGLVGSEIRWSNFAEAWSTVPFGRFMANGLFVAVAGTVVVCVTSVLSAYAFARLRFRFRDRIFLLYLGTLMVPQEVTVVPMFILMQQFRWVDSYAALILPWAFTAFGTFLLRQFFLTIPRELEEAATIDGATAVGTFRRIVLPLSKPVLATFALFYAVGIWNDFMSPLLYLSDTSMWTLQIYLRQVTASAELTAGDIALQETPPAQGVKFAVIAVATLPILLFYPFLQKHFAKGMLIGSVKG